MLCFTIVIIAVRVGLFIAVRVGLFRVGLFRFVATKHALLAQKHASVQLLLRSLAARFSWRCSVRWQRFSHLGATSFDIFLLAKFNARILLADAKGKRILCGLLLANVSPCYFTRYFSACYFAG